MSDCCRGGWERKGVGMRRASTTADRTENEQRRGQSQHGRLSEAEMKRLGEKDCCSAGARAWLWLCDPLVEQLAWTLAAL